ncbi:hypothetical protein A8C56_21025 [Niabella ginsenosidivorans]|uniref:Import component protein n=1 Tax=Niabella ginsenosidivorans TaxID=1176587 RepID=A0A1A9I8Y4_9BACT|nr:hypothetical protein [Niabella ginsenosidivorans]ANH83132.1 hypothetical protein A8C56_21025 [Niabella ginsenosidivorans]
MTAKQLSILAYFTFIGWAISYIRFIKGAKSNLLQYHLKQSLGLIVLSVLYGLVLRLLALAAPEAAAVLTWAGIVLFILLVMGMINALNETERPIPFIGRFFENRFPFIR